MEETKSELVAEIAELKLQLLTYSRLFTLTSEEVEPVKKLLSNKLFELKHFLNDWKYRDGEMASCIQKDIDTYQPILTRIKQWQDENRTDN